MENKYLYEVHPTRVIRIPGQPPLRHPKSMLLSKEEVMSYMDFGRVYRKPSKSIEAILVTGENLDKLHVEDSQIDFTGLTKVASEKTVVVAEQAIDNDTSADEYIEAEEEETVEKDVDEEPVVKNLEEEALSVDGNEDETTVDIEEEALPEVETAETDVVTEAKEYEPVVVNTAEAVPAVETIPAESVAHVVKSSNNTSFQMKNNGNGNYHKNNNHHKGNKK